MTTKKYKHKTHTCTLRLLVEQLGKGDVRRTNGSNSPRQERSASGLAENGEIQHVNGAARDLLRMRSRGNGIMVRFKRG